MLPPRAVPPPHAAPPPSRAAPHRPAHGLRSIALVSERPSPAVGGEAGVWGAGDEGGETTAGGGRLAVLESESS